MAGNTPEVDFYLPGGGSTGTYLPDETADIDRINENFVKADNAFIADRARLTDIEKYTKSTGANNGVVPAGTTAQRNTYWGTPANAADRVALANRYARWFNTDKGWEEQYFAQFDDAGVTASTPVQPAHGWGPAVSNGRVLLTRFTAAINGTGTVTKKGGKVEFNTAQGLLIDNVFTADFDRYEMEMTVTGGSTTASLEARFRAATVTDSSSNYSYSFREIVPGTAEAAIGPTTQMEISRAFVSGFILKSTIANPVDAARKTQMLNHMFDTDTKTRIGGSQLNLNKAVDGLWLDFTGTATFTGEVRFYGIAN